MSQQPASNLVTATPRAANSSELTHLIGCIIGPLVAKHGISHFYKTDKSRHVYGERVKEVVQLARDLVNEAQTQRDSA